MREHLRPTRASSIEPGRSLVAESGVTLYRVVTVKRGARRTFVAVDGGMGDNLEVVALRPAFEAAIAAGRAGEREPETCDLVGHHCESGDP